MDTLDINNLSSVAAFVHRMEGKMFDVVLVNAGTGGPEGKTPETVSSEDMTHLIMTNAISPVRLAGKLLPMVKPDTGILAFMSSVLGSVEQQHERRFAVVQRQQGGAEFAHAQFCRDLGRPENHRAVAASGLGADGYGRAACRYRCGNQRHRPCRCADRTSRRGGPSFLDYTGKTLPW